MTANGNPINDDLETVPIVATQVERGEQAAEPVRRRNRRGKSSRLLWGTGILLGILIIGAAAWKVLPHQLASDDGEEIAEIDGFESEAPVLAVPKTEDFLSSQTQAESLIVPPPMADEPRTPSRSGNAPMVSVGARNSANAWLTGTIEDAEASERIGLPERVSGGPDDATIVR